MPARWFTVLAGFFICFLPAAAQPHAVTPQLLGSTISPPVHTLPPQAHAGGPPKEIPRHHPPGRPNSGTVTDPVVQHSTLTPALAAAGGQWEGMGAGYPGFSITAVPPDTNMAVGPNHIVQWVNNAFVVFSKTGGTILAPVSDSDFWANANCNQLGGFSDPIVKYDRIADRWFVGEVALPAFPGLLGQYAQCFAVSATSDPTGSYYMWGYGFGNNVNDYDKIAVWPDGYYVTWNIFLNGATFNGPEACAWNRNDMLSGVSAPRFVCFNLPDTFSSLLAADLDGANAPPAGSPNFVMSVDTSTGALNLWKFHVNYTTPGNSTLTGPILVAGVAPFNSPCLSTQDCIPQPATTQNVDALADRLMYRLGYRNFGDHESLVANHTVLSGTNTAVRWYEVRSPNGAPTVYQQGTFAPDTDNRWMASLAMDKSGNIGVGYSVSSSVTFPSIRYTGWEVGNPLGMLQSETQMVSGSGSQTGYNRWGDYSAMLTDPSDDCTFWYTTEYIAVTAAANWSTRIGSFHFSSCGQTLTPTTTTLGSSQNPSSVGQLVTFTAAVTSGSGTPTGSVTFKDGSATLATVALSGGTAQYPTSSLAAGGHSITAVYSGDATYAGSTSGVLTQTVNKLSTTTGLVSSQNPSNAGNSVTFTATVLPSAATGSVTFKDGSNALGTVALSGGSASLTTSSLSAGSHNITAIYGGDGTYSGSTSGTVVQVVNTTTKLNTTTTLTSSPNPSNKGQTVTFTGAVSPSTGPTGTVTFKDRTTTLGTRALSSGIATLSTSSLSTGSHSITATYNGDTNYNGSTSGAVTQTVRNKH